MSLLSFLQEKDGKGSSGRLVFILLNLCLCYVIVTGGLDLRDLPTLAALLAYVAVVGGFKYANPFAQKGE